MELRNGVAAFDPVTLRIAAEQLPLVQLPSALDAEMPEHLCALATVEVSPFDVAAKIDTGQLTWAHPAQAKPFVAYDGSEVSGVSLSGARVASLADATVARVSIKLEDRKLRAWFAEVPGNLDLDGFQLVADARRWMKDFSTEDKKVDTLTVPQQDVDYEAFVKGLDRPTRQKIRAVVDEKGSRVIAETVIMSSLPSWGAPKHVVLGERGPVVFWFSEGNENKALPFAVVYTEAEAWVGAR
ncbi:MAG: hypothetical protein GX859_12865 [Corynebacterium humireducens]|jgi:hypothetical protein|uniref:Uncharacterized protein n=1 Tax=Corynebacterium humireducens TaxID=1223514 RepID=A0A7X6PQ78_9CORY|nr:hypothetical protein [Corynebacterium humireducens]